MSNAKQFHLQFFHLHSNLQDIMNGIKVQNPVLQVLNSNVFDNGGKSQCRIRLSDGDHTSNYVVLDSSLDVKTIHGMLTVKTIIRLDKYYIHTENNKKLLVIQSAKILHNGTDVATRFGRYLTTLDPATS